MNSFTASRSSQIAADAGGKVLLCCETPRDLPCLWQGAHARQGACCGGHSSFPASPGTLSAGDGRLRSAARAASCSKLGNLSTASACCAACIAESSQVKLPTNSRRMPEATPGRQWVMRQQQWLQLTYLSATGYAIRRKDVSSHAALQAVFHACMRCSATSNHQADPTLLK